MKATNKDESVVNTEKAVKSSTQSTESSASKNSSKAMDATKKNYKKANSSTKHSPIDVKKNIEAKIDMFFEANKEFGIRKLISATKLMEVGANIGSQPKYWNPKMKPYIYAKKTGKNQTIDLLKCMVYLDRAYNFLRDLTKEGGRILIVGTRGEIIKNHVKEECKRAKCFYVNQRWLGGTLTNFRTINKSIAKLNNLIMMQLNDEIKKFTKKEQLQKIKETERLGKFFGGIRTMKGLPQAIVVLDPVVEHNAVEEAHKLHIPVVALANTNADPTNIDFLIPCNTMSIKTVYLLTSILCDAICEGLGEPLAVIGKKDEEIVLPETTKRVQNQEFINRTSYTKAATAPVEKPAETK